MALESKNEATGTNYHWISETILSKFQKVGLGAVKWLEKTAN